MLCQLLESCCRNLSCSENVFFMKVVLFSTDVLERLVPLLCCRQIFWHVFCPTLANITKPKRWIKIWPLGNWKTRFFFDERIQGSQLWYWRFEHDALTESLPLSRSYDGIERTLTCSCDRRTKWGHHNVQPVGPDSAYSLMITNYTHSAVVSLERFQLLVVTCFAWYKSEISLLRSISNLTSSAVARYICTRPPRCLIRRV